VGTGRKDRHDAANVHFLQLFLNAPRMSHAFFNVIFLATSIKILQMIQRLSGQTGTVKDEANGCDIIINQGQVFIYVYPMTNLMYKFIIY
jgi:hypothetical protein